LLSKPLLSSTVEVCWSYLIILLYKMLIAIDQVTLTTRCSGRILHPRLPKKDAEAFFQMDLSNLPSSILTEPLKTSRSSSTRLRLESKDLDGAGSYVSYPFTAYSNAHLF
jgi:hypothetical protein